MENQLNSSGICSQNFVHCRLLQVIQNDLRKRNIKHEKFTDQIIFMSMFNDIDWTRKGNDGLCIWNSAKVKEYAKRFPQGHWTFRGHGDEKKWYGTLFFIHLKENGTLQPPKWWSDSKLPVVQLSRGILKKKNNRDTIHFNADASNHSALIPNHSFCKSAQYLPSSFELVYTNRSIGGRELERPFARKESVTKGVLSSVNSQEVKLLVSSPRPASGNRLQKNIQDFEFLSETIRFKRVCEDAVFTHRVSAGMSYKTRADEDDGFGQLVPLCREYTLSQGNPQSGVFGAIPGGLIIGPVIEVQFVKKS